MSRAVVFFWDSKLDADIDNWFVYHAPTSAQLDAYAEIREAARTFARAVNRRVPPGADKMATIRKIREAVMTANAGIATDHFLQDFDDAEGKS